MSKLVLVIKISSYKIRQWSVGLIVRAIDNFFIYLYLSVAWTVEIQLQKVTQLLLWAPPKMLANVFGSWGVFLPIMYGGGDSAGAADVVHGGASMHPRHPRLLLEALVIPSPLPRYVSRQTQATITLADRGGSWGRYPPESSKHLKKSKVSYSYTVLIMGWEVLFVTILTTSSAKYVTV